MKWHQKQDFILDLDNILGEDAYNHIMENVSEYFAKENTNVDEKEVRNVYEYLKEKNKEAIDKLDYSISEENKQNIERGVTAQMIKLLSQKKALEKRYQKEEELLRLADNVMSMGNNEIDEIVEVLNKYQKQE